MVLSSYKKIFFPGFMTAAVFAQSLFLFLKKLNIAFSPIFQSSKTTGEPGVLLGFSIMVALRRALEEVYRDRGVQVPFFQMGKQYNYTPFLLLYPIVFFLKFVLTLQTVLPQTTRSWSGQGSPRMTSTFDLTHREFKE